MEYDLEKFAYIQKDLSTNIHGFLSTNHFLKNDKVILYGMTRKVQSSHVITFEYFYKSKILLVHCGEAKLSGVNNVSKFLKQCGIISITAFVIYYSKNFVMSNNSHKFQLILSSFKPFNIYNVSFVLDDE
jgi:hypothetical protein